MTVSTLKKKLVLQAVQALRELNNKYYEDSSKKKPLLEDEAKSTVYLQVTLKKIPKNKQIQMVKVNLPHSLITDSDEICLITGDLDKKNHKAEIEPDVLHYKSLLEKHGVTQISQVITLRQLRTEYKPYEAKQKLLGAYDLFLADSKIAECLPRILGRHFFKKRKLPIQVNLKTSNIKQQIETALSKTVFYISGKGNSCVSEVAYLDMEDTEIIENVLAMSEALSKNIPGTWCNVMGVYLKTAKSKAIPIYISYDSPNDVELPTEKEEDEVLFDELNTIPNIKVKVYSDGRVQTVRVEEDVEAQESDTEKNCKDFELKGVESDTEKGVDCEVELENECNDMVTFKMKDTKPVKSKKRKGSANLKENIKQELVLSNQSEKKNTKPVKSKKKKGSANLEENIEQELVLSNQSEKKIESNKESKKAALKRKRNEDESASLESEQVINDNEVHARPTKKRKIEGINMKKYQDMKESKKNKKKNQPRTKQRR